MRDLRQLRRTRGLAHCFSLLLSVFGAQRAHAGNDEGILIGSDAILTGGAVTAIVSDGAAAWYNPAGLAHSTRPTLNINASAYGISLVSADNLFVLPDGTSGSAQVTDWQLIPTALSFTRALSKRVVGCLSVMIPATTDADLRSSLVQADGTRFTFGIDTFRNEYDYMASVGFRASDALRFGTSLHGIYISSEEMTQVGVGTPGAQNLPFQSSSYHATIGDYGLRLGVGVQWTPRAGLDLGLALQTPTLTGFRRSNVDSVDGTFLGVGEANEFQSSHENKLAGVWEFSTPLVVRAGVALQLGNAQLLVDGSVFSPLNSSEAEFDRKFSGNLRLASLIRLSNKLAMGVGTFTDLNGARAPAPNYVGLAGGIRFTSDYLIQEGERPLSFITTLGGRYAYGFGHIDGLDLRALISGAEPVKPEVQVHELAFNLSSGVTF